MQASGGSSKRGDEIRSRIISEKLTREPGEQRRSPRVLIGSHHLDECGTRSSRDRMRDLDSGNIGEFAEPAELCNDLVNAPVVWPIQAKLIAIARARLDSERAIPIRSGDLEPHDLHVIAIERPPGHRFE